MVRIHEGRSAEKGRVKAKTKGEGKGRTLYEQFPKIMR